MKWASSVGVGPAFDEAVARVLTEVSIGLGGDEPDVAFVFVSIHHLAHLEMVAELFAAQLPSAVVIGCSGGAVIGGGEEVERSAGVALTAACLPDVQITPFHVETESCPAADEPYAWRALLGLDAREDPAFVLLPEPFSCDVESLITGLDAAYPGAPKVGGMASGAREPGVNTLFLGDQSYRSGCVGLALTGAIEMDAIVAQGCRPIGDPYFVTRCGQNLVFELDGRAPQEVVSELFESLPTEDQRLLSQALFVGIGMDEAKHQYRSGDFLIRNVAGIHSPTGGLVVGTRLEPNQVIQFHVRDAASAAADLARRLDEYTPPTGAAEPGGALLFSCLGRGVQLYGRPSQDSQAFADRIGPIPLGGFFCNGEIGPVGRMTFLHGYTSAFAVFRPAGSRG